MNVYFTKLYETESIRQLTDYYEAAQKCGFKELSLYANPDMNIDDQQLSAQMDGSVAGFAYGGYAIIQFPTGMGIRYDSKLINSIKQFENSRIIFNISSTELVGASIGEGYAQLYDEANGIIITSNCLQILTNNGLDIKNCVVSDLSTVKNNLQLHIIKSYIDSLVAVSD